MLLLPPLFLHFTLVFPERPQSRAHAARARSGCSRFYCRRGAVSTRIVRARRASRRSRSLFARLTLLDQIEPLYLSAFMIAGLVVLMRAMDRASVRHRAAAASLDYLGHRVRRGPFAIGYALPFALGLRVSLPMELSADPLSLVPLAFASALIRYRLMDVEVIVKRSLVYTAVILAIFTIYATLSCGSPASCFEREHATTLIIAMLATIVVDPAVQPVKSAIQNALDRAFYRDSYDYRRALVGFARDLNSDLDLDRLGERLVARIRETFVIDRMALLLVDEASGDYDVIRARTSAISAVRLSRDSGSPRACRRARACRSTIRWLHGAFTAEEVEFWRDARHPLLRSLRIERRTECGARARPARTGRAADSEDMGLLSAVGSQAATALENGRLYRQLHVKACELHRLQHLQREHPRVARQRPAGVGLNDRVIRWNQRSLDIYGSVRRRRAGHKLDRLFDAHSSRPCAPARDHPKARRCYRVPLAGARRPDERSCS